MTTRGFKIVEHMADWAVRVYGRSLTDLLVEAAQGMNCLLVDANTAVSGSVTRQVELDVYDAETLLVEWLSELAYWAETDGLVFTEFDFHDVSAIHLRATVRGGRAAVLNKHIKAVTYHNLEIIETDDGLEATIVFDV